MMTPRHPRHHHHLPLVHPPRPPRLRRAPWPPTGAGGQTGARGSRRRWRGRPWASVWEVSSGEVQSWRNSSPGAVTAVLWSCSQGSVGPGREKTEGKPNTGKKVSAFIVLLIRLSWVDQPSFSQSNSFLRRSWTVFMEYLSSDFAVCQWKGKSQIWDFWVHSLLASLIPGSVINCISLRIISSMLICQYPWSNYKIARTFFIPDSPITQYVNLIFLLGEIYNSYVTIKM